MAERIRVWVTRFPDRTPLQLQWIDPATGKKRTKTSGTADPTQAEAKRADLEYELNHGLVTPGQRCTWGAFRAAFEREYVAGQCRNTRLNFLAALDSLESLCRPAMLDGVTSRTLSQWVAACRSGQADNKRTASGQLADSTIAVRLDFLRSALSWAVRQGLLPKLPELPKVRRLDGEPRPVPAEQFEQLLAAAGDAQERLYLLLGWEAGLRREEAVRLSWEASERVPWVDLERGRIVFPPSGNKGRRSCWVPLSQRLRGAIESARNKQQTTDNKQQTSLLRVFPAWTVATASHLFAGLAGRAGVALTMKSLRRGFACRYASQVPAQVLQRLMRHGNIAVTMKYYANVDAAVEMAVNGNGKSNNPSPNPG